MSNVAPSFLEIYNAYFGFVWSTSIHYGVRPCEVDDVTQDVFVTIFRKFQSMERAECMRSWVYTIVRRTVRKYHRKKLTRVLHITGDAIDPELQTREPLSNADFQLSENADLLRKLLSKLEPVKREVFILADLEDLSAPEIAGTLHVPLNTVYSRLRSARAELKLALCRHEHGARVRVVPVPKSKTQVPAAPTVIPEREPSSQAS